MKNLKLKKEREKAITEAVKSLSEDICRSIDMTENEKRAKTIKCLMDSLN